MGALLALGGSPRPGSRLFLGQHRLYHVENASRDASASGDVGASRDADAGRDANSFADAHESEWKGAPKDANATVLRDGQP